MIPLRQRNWAMMVLAFIALILLVLTVVLLLMAVPGSSTFEGQIWLWLTIGVTSIASVLSLFALITGDPLWFLVGIILARSR